MVRSSRDSSETGHIIRPNREGILDDKGEQTPGGTTMEVNARDEYVWEESFWERAE